MFKDQSVAWCVLEPTEHEHALHGGEEGQEHQGQGQRVEDERIIYDECDGLLASGSLVAVLFATEIDDLVEADCPGSYGGKPCHANGELNEDARLHDYPVQGVDFPLHVLGDSR